MRLRCSLTREVDAGGLGEDLLAIHKKIPTQTVAAFAIIPPPLLVSPSFALSAHAGRILTAGPVFPTAGHWIFLSNLHGERLYNVWAPYKRSKLCNISYY